MPDPLTPEGYAQTGGTRCPACLRKARLTRGSIVASTDAETTLRRWGCQACGATWRAVYELTGYEGLTTPEEDTS